MKRTFDIVASTMLAVVLAIPMLILAALVKITSRGPVLYWSSRVGKNNRLFMMPKFRTMRTDTPEVATHLLDSPEQWLTPIGSLLRRTSLDELPQLWCVFTGEMSLVGPRPALHNQFDLVELRTQAGVHTLIPGVTGWAQINGRDDLSIPVKVKFDTEYLHEKSLMVDCKILLLTFLRVLSRKGVQKYNSASEKPSGTSFPHDRAA